jgi:DNA-binding NarL/FixJ family response regulator
VLFDDSSWDLIAELFRAGARGIFNRSEYDLDLLCRCISCVASGQIWANSEQLAFILDVFGETPSLNIVNATGELMLTRRERDVVKLVAEGFSNREIGQQLSLSVHTVKNYLFNIFEKLGISNRSELLMYVLANSDNTRLSVVDGGQSREDDVATTKHTPTREMQPNRGARTQRLLAS